jgi:hypothetical protein
MSGSAVCRVVLWCVVVGVAAGVLARLAMRGVVVVTHGDPSFSPAGTFGILMLFIVAALGSGLAGFVRWPMAARVLLAAAATALVIYSGAVIGTDEILSAKDRGLDTTSWLLLLLITAAIIAMTMATPVVSWRLGSHHSRSR